MVLPLLLLWCLSVVFAGIEQIRYAKQNYPKSALWRVRLFLSGFCSGFLLMSMLMFNSSSLQEMLLTSSMTGFASGLLSAFGFPYNMRGWYPKRQDSGKNEM